MRSILNETDNTKLHLSLLSVVPVTVGLSRSTTTLRSRYLKQDDIIKNTDNPPLPQDGAAPSHSLEKFSQYYILNGGH